MFVDRARIAVTDTEDWEIAIPVLGDLDLTGSELSAAITPITGGAPIVSATSDDGAITVLLRPSTTFAAYILFHVPSDARIWQTARPVTLVADIHRLIAGTNRRIGSTTFLVEPDSASLAVADVSGSTPVLTRSLAGRTVLAEPIVVAHQAPNPLPAIPSDAALVDYRLGLVGGLLAWIAEP